MNENVQNVSSKSKKQIVLGIMSILFYSVGVDKFILHDKKGGIKMIISTLLFYLFRYICFPFILIRNIKGIINGVKILKMSEKEFSDYLNNYDNEKIKVPSKILTGIMSILFHIFGVDNFILKQKAEGFNNLIKTVLLTLLSGSLFGYSYLLFYQFVDGVKVAVNRGIVENVLTVIIYVVAFACISLVLINFVKGILNGIKIIKMNPSLFEKEISYNSKSNVEVLRYRNNKIAYNLSLTAIAVQCLSFVAIYSALTFTSKFMTGFDIVINIVFLLVTFLVAEKVKTYRIGWGITSIILGIVNSLRIFTYLYNTNSGENIFLVENVAQYRFVAAVLCYIIVMLLLVISGIVTIIRGIKLEKFLKNHNKEVK